MTVQTVLDRLKILLKRKHDIDPVYVDSSLLDWFNQANEWYYRNVGKLTYEQEGVSVAPSISLIESTTDYDKVGFNITSIEFNGYDISQNELPYSVLKSQKSLELNGLYWAVYESMLYTAGTPEGTLNFQVIYYPRYNLADADIIRTEDLNAIEMYFYYLVFSYLGELQLASNYLQLAEVARRSSMSGTHRQDAHTFKLYDF